MCLDPGVTPAVQPSMPVTLHVHGGRLELPVMEEPSPWPAPVFEAGDDASGESAEGVVWRVERDVLAGRTTCVIDHGSEYDAPYGTVVEHYAGRVSVDTATFERTMSIIVKHRSDIDLVAARVGGKLGAPPGLETEAAG